MGAFSYGSISVFHVTFHRGVAGLILGLPHRVPKIGMQREFEEG